MNNIVRFVALAALATTALFWASCNRNVEQEPADIQVKGDTLFIAETSAICSKLEVETVCSRDYSFEYSVTGVVKPIPGKMAEIAPPFEGRIHKASVQLGQKVRAGTPVFEMHSADFYQAAKEYFQAVQAKEAKESNVRRQRNLVQNGVGVVKELEEAELEYKVAVTDLENAAAFLHMFHIDPAALRMGQPLKVVSPIDGEVVENQVVIGQYVKDEEEPLVVVANLDYVRVVAEVKERYLQSINPKDRVEIYTDAYPDHAFEGTISYVGKLLDEETRSVQVFITCDNSEGFLRPGMFARVRFINEPKLSVMVPATAVLQGQESPYVLVQIAERVFVKRPVAAVTANAHEVIVIQGLEPDEVIVKEGGIYLITD